MTGGLAYFKDLRDDPPYDRLRFEFTNGYYLAYTSRRLLGRIGLCATRHEFLEEKGLGPDALDSRFTLTRFGEAASVARRPVKSFVMDQSKLAGIGNIYADEILFQARIHPSVSVDSLTAKEVERLFRKVKSVLRIAVKRRAGSEEFLDRLPPRYMLPQRHKEGHCPRCHRKLGTVRLSGRTGYYCPGCQRKGRS